MELDVDAYDDVVADGNPAMLVVTVAAEDHRAGCLVSFATACSIEPRRFCVFLSVPNHTFRVAERAEHLAIHHLGGDQHALAAHFGELTGDDVDKLAGVAWTPGPGGVPVLDEAPAWFAGRILERHLVGDHVAFVLEPVAAERRRSTELLRLSDVGDLEPGHAAGLPGDS